MFLINLQFSKDLVSDLEVFHFCVPFQPIYVLHIWDAVFWSVTSDCLAGKHCWLQLMWLVFVDPCITVQFIKKNPTGCNNVSDFYYSIFIWSSTCFGRRAAHRQEPKTAPAASGFSYVWEVVGRVDGGRCQAHQIWNNKNIDTFYCINPNKMHKSQSLFLSENCSTCFGFHYHPSSGAQNNCNYNIW